MSKGTRIFDVNKKILGWIRPDDMKRVNTKLLLGGTVSWAGDVILAKESFIVTQHSEHILRGCKIDGIDGINKFSVYLTKAELEKADDYFIKHVVIEKVNRK